MEKQAVKETVSSVVCEVLEQMAFMFPEPAAATDEIPWDSFSFVLAKLSFAGDHKGESWMAAPVEFCAELSANMLGEDIDESDNADKHCDALKEILNIVTGQLLTQCFGDQVIFNLTAPETQKLTVEQVRQITEDIGSSFSMVDEYPVIAQFIVEEG